MHIRNPPYQASKCNRSGKHAAENNINVFYSPQLGHIAFFFVLRECLVDVRCFDNRFCVANCQDRVAAVRHNRSQFPFISADGVLPTACGIALFLTLAWRARSRHLCFCGTCPCLWQCRANSCRRLKVNKSLRQCCMCPSPILPKHRDQAFLSLFALCNASTCANFGISLLHSAPISYRSFQTSSSWRELGTLQCGMLNKTL